MRSAQLLEINSLCDNSNTATQPRSQQQQQQRHQPHKPNSGPSGNSENPLLNPSTTTASSQSNSQNAIETTNYEQQHRQIQQVLKHHKLQEQQQQQQQQQIQYYIQQHIKRQLETLSRHTAQQQQQVLLASNLRYLQTSSERAENLTMIDKSSKYAKPSVVTSSSCNGLSSAGSYSSNDLSIKEELVDEDVTGTPIRKDETANSLVDNEDVNYDRERIKDSQETADHTEDDFADTANDEDINSRTELQERETRTSNCESPVYHATEGLNDVSSHETALADNSDGGVPGLKHTAKSCIDGTQNSQTIDDNSVPNKRRRIEVE